MSRAPCRISEVPDSGSPRRSAPISRGRIRLRNGLSAHRRWSRRHAPAAGPDPCLPICPICTGSTSSRNPRTASIHEPWRSMSKLFSSVHGAQVLLATHSPIILSLARPERFCASRRNQGGRHRYRPWHRSSAPARLAPRDGPRHPVRERGPRMTDLVVLVADKDVEQVVATLLGRRTVPLGFAISGAIVSVHPRRDPGCRTEAVEFAHVSREPRPCPRPLRSRGQRRGGHRARRPGGPDQGRSRRKWLGGRCRGGRDRTGARSVVLESAHATSASCLDGATADALRDWLEAEGAWRSNASKPRQPKDAFETALRHVGRPRSSAIFGDLATKASLAGHHEPAFIRFRSALLRWFPP